MKQKVYISIDLKSFYASVECVARGLNPLTTNLVVADESRTEKTICLAISPAMKAYGISGRARLFEVVQRVNEINAARRMMVKNRTLTGSSYNSAELSASPELSLDYIVARPQMARYMEISGNIYNTYLKYVAPEDIHVYSVDEVFIDATDYLSLYKLPPHDFALKMILDVLGNTGITATAGIGTNLYLSKIAMDIGAKRIQPDENGVRIAQLDEMSYRNLMWGHRPLTDFWRVGRGYAKKLEQHGMYTMGDIARRSLIDEDIFYKLFGVNAELLIDHAWGYESCTIADIKAYRPSTNSISSGQVLQSPYDFDKAKLIVKEMTDLLVLDLVDKGLVTDQIVLTIGYDIENLADPIRRENYKGEIITDHYGRAIPQPAHGSVNIEGHSSSTTEIMTAAMQLYEQIVDRKLLVRRVNVTANHVISEDKAIKQSAAEQLDLFADYDALQKQGTKETEQRERERRIQNAELKIKKKHGKNAILRGMNLEEGATAKSRNEQIGGHKA